MITQCFYLLRNPTLFWSSSEAAEWDHIDTDWQCSHRHPLTTMACVWGRMWTPCLPPPPEWDRRPCPVQWLWGRRPASSASLLLAYRSDRYGHAISRLGRLISSKGDYFPSSAFPHISLSFSTATPRCSGSILLLSRISRHAVIWTWLIPVILWGALIVTAASLGFLQVFN